MKTHAYILYHMHIDSEPSAICTKLGAEIEVVPDWLGEIVISSSPKYVATSFGNQPFSSSFFAFSPLLIARSSV